MSLFWYQPNPVDNPHSYECWNNEEKTELIGYVDLLYTTLEKNKYIGSFEMNRHPEQEEQDAYFFSVEDAKDHVESEYMAWRMIGTLTKERD
jgi:hypothetical protein